MKKNIIFTSQKDFIKLFNTDLFANQDTIAISIVTTKEDKFEINKNFKDSIQLVFEDSESSFTTSQAEQILNFVNLHRNQIKHIVIHCLFGISRSAAVSLFLEEYLNESYVSDITRSEYANYNRYIYSVLYNTLYGDMYK